MKIDLTNQEYKNLVMEFSFDSDIKPEIYRVLKYNHYVENLGINDNQMDDLVFKIQDKICDIYLNNLKN
tara:strand:- start:188 stop:394 length:207 start_codon:yes stop_codon:yes gene_type:complete